MTTEEKKAYLNSYLANLRKLQGMQEEYNQLFIARTSISVSMDGTPRAHNPTGLEVYAAKRDALARAITKQKTTCLDALADIYYNIEQLTDKDITKTEEDKVILTYKYILGLSFDEIGAKLDRTRQHINRLHGRALECFSVSVRTIPQRKRQTDE